MSAFSHLDQSAVARALHAEDSNRLMVKISRADVDAVVGSFNHDARLQVSALRVDIITTGLEQQLRS